MEQESFSPAIRIDPSPSSPRLRLSSMLLPCVLIARAGQGFAVSKDYNAEGIARSAVRWVGLMRLGPTRMCFPSLLLVVCLSGELNAQTTTSGGLTGVVTDPSHAVVPGADVEIRDTAKGTTQSTKTDRDGVYRFFFLSPGRYTLAVTRGGFRKESRALKFLLAPPLSVNVPPA